MDTDHVILECDAESAEDLYGWLADEPELRPYLTVRYSPPPPDHMGDAADILITAVSAGGVLTVLAGSLKSWIRRRAVSVHVRSGDSDIEITANRADDAGELLRQVLTNKPRS